MLINIKNGNVQPTVEQKQLAVKSNIISELNIYYQQSITGLNNIYNSIFKRVDLTSQEVLDSFGNDLPELLGVLGTFKNAINAVVPDTIKDIK